MQHSSHAHSEADNRSSSPARRGREAPAGELLNIAEVAAALRMSKMSVYRFIHAGQLPALRVGSSFRVYRTDLRAFLKSAFLAGAGPESGPESGAGPDAEAGSAADA